jgi:hypothetical protein
LASGLLSSLPSGAAWARAADAPATSARGDYYSILVAERRIGRLPDGPLYWKIETFSTAAAASDATSSDFALTASIAERNWLFTLGAKGAAGHGGTAIAEIGPIAAPRARSLLLRVSHAGGPPGSRTATQMRPGSEVSYVLSGQISQRTPHGTTVGGAGDALNETAPGTAKQTISTGAVDLEQIVLSVVDADSTPQSPPAAKR